MKRFFLVNLSLIALLMSVGTVSADSSTDYFLQNDRASMQDQNPEGLADYYQDYIEWLLVQGYSPASIITSSVGRGLTLADVIYMMSRARPESAVDYFNIAETLLPNLPGWVCSNPNVIGHRYDKPLDKEGLSEESTLAQVVDLYFDENERFTKVPDWQNGVGHTNVSVDELLQFKQAEIDLVSSNDENPVDSWWYLGRDENAEGVVVVGLYPDQRRVVIDARLSELQTLDQKGVDRVPVMFMYNEDKHIPVSDVERVAGKPYGGSEMKGDDKDDYVDLNDGEITASEVIKRFESDQQMVPPPRDWRTGDHHLMVRTDELLQLFQVPEKDEIEPEVWQEALARLNESPFKPLHITLFRDADGERWLDKSSVVAAAKDQDVKRIPVVFFYHGMDRQPCGMPGACIEDIRAAAISGSECPECFSTDPNGQPTPVPPVIVPPGDGPISPN